MLLKAKRYHLTRSCLQLPGILRRGYWARNALHAESAPPALATEIVTETKPNGWFKRLRQRSSAASEPSTVPASGLEVFVPQQATSKTAEALKQQQLQEEIRPRHNQEWMQRHLQVVGFLGKAGLVSAAGLGLFTLLR
jgi:hypothetical protein